MAVRRRGGFGAELSFRRSIEFKPTRNSAAVQCAERNSNDQVHSTRSGCVAACLYGRIGGTCFSPGDVGHHDVAGVRGYRGQGAPACPSPSLSRPSPSRASASRPSRLLSWRPPLSAPVLFASLRLAHPRLCGRRATLVLPVNLFKTSPGSTAPATSGRHFFMGTLRRRQLPDFQAHRERVT